MTNWATKNMPVKSGTMLRDHRPTAAMLGLAASTLLSGVGAVSAQEGTYGTWEVSAYSGDLPAACLMTHTDQRNGRLIVFLDEYGIKRPGYMHDTFQYNSGDEPTVRLMLDGKVTAVTYPSVPTRNTILMQGNDEGVGPTLADTILGSTTIAIEIKDQGHTFQTSRTEDAVEALKGCVKRVKMPESARVDQERGKQFSGQGAEPSDEQAAAVLPDKKAAPIQANEANHLRDALGTMGSAAPMLAQFRCAITGSEIMGLPDINGPGRSDIVGFTLGDDGSLVVNAARLKPVFVDAAGDTQRWVFNAREVLSAVMSQPSGRAPVVGLTAEQQRSYDTVMGTYLPSLANLVMGDKPRYMLIDLGADAVGFFDLDDADRPANQQAGDCVRVD